MRSERKIVFLLCTIAAVRVFVFSAAFPFFNNVDEEAHFDLVVRYSHGQFPHAFDPISAESAQYIVRFGSPEYLSPAEPLDRAPIPPPLWKQPGETVAGVLPASIAAWQTVPNHEASSPPLYYGLTGLWLRLGRGCGLEGGFLLYWLRFLNVLLAAALVWLGHRAARAVFPERFFLRVGVPLLLALFPQDIFYSIQSDVLSPLCFGAAFLALVMVLRADVPGYRWATTTGLALAATCLVKTSNLPLLLVAVSALAFKTGQLVKAGTLRPALPALICLIVCVALPVGGWSAWSRHAFGDWTGSTSKVELLGWVRKPISHWWPHPIFTPAGLRTFWSELMASFWRGEFVWFQQRLASPTMDAFYWISSTVLPVAALVGLVKTSANTTPSPRLALGLAFGSVAAAVAFLVLMSVAFDFGNCFYPSPAHPYFTSGRLLSGALVPFALVYLHGLDRLLGRTLSDRLRLLILAGLMLSVTISEIVVNLPAFRSEYNWFHLWS